MDFVTGTAAFYGKAVFERTGLLNQEFVMYNEYVEFGLLVNRPTDYGICMFNEKLVKHNAGSARLMYHKVVYYLHRNLMLLSRKHSGRSIPIVLLHGLREIRKYLLVSVLRLSPGYPIKAFYMSGGTLAGSVRSQRG